MPPSEVYDTIEAALQMASYQNYTNKAEMRPKIDAALTWLRTQREQDAGQWQPVENGEYDSGDNNTLSIMGNEEGEEFCCIEANRANGKHESVELDLSMKVCRRVPTPAPQE